MTLKWCALTAWFMASAMGLAQTGIHDAVSLTLEDGGLECGGHARILHVWLDLGGVTGTNGEPAGLNAFCTALDMDDDLYLGVMPGASCLDWSLFSTERLLANAAQKAIAVGVKADPDAPDALYHLATFYFGGQETTCTVWLDDLSTSFGSRVVLATGDGPGGMPFSWNGPIPLSLPTPFPFSLNDGFASWRQDNAAFDLAAPTGLVDVRDLVKCMVCIP